ncbi:MULTISPECIES: hypothetical protein [Prevotella]|uniref:hypothetical protein n=1 Tax=Prevotella TaxID=838 RepID=UPI001BA4E074|nr:MULTISPECIES: hypothetical protein [Prevotella]MBF1429993.1 hypothetical protein [Prevotella melaninogenica]MBF1636290.1 hypothetical protein [Prevotella sp.]QUB67708.1 hypothetical protein J5A68_06605 [Prevotella melaninogenica]QUB78423.1 hypothetical protein J4857_02025 [Prevotella jejuni]
MNILLLGSLISDLIPMGLVVVFPILYVWLTERNKQHETDKRSEIAMAIIEKNPDIDIQEFLNKLNPPKESYKEKMLKIMHYEVLWGTICMIGGIATILVVVVLSILQDFDGAFIPLGSVFGIVPLAVGCGLLAAYNNAKKTLENLKDND